ncbi:hypothetical protein QE390_000917 [Siphonobacter sp. SORGH_AS 1065]|nr:hypothetical protein [Siphonobacter sp. SORGH_AS_1065]
MAFGLQIRKSVEIGVLLTWIKEKGKWVLLDRQAYKVS